MRVYSVVLIFIILTIIIYFDAFEKLCQMYFLLYSCDK
jgi:hypothetical protein